MTARAQSETLGFVFVFALITLTVGAVYALGVPAIQDAQNAERDNNMVRAFEVLDDNVDDVARKGAPSRATEIKLAGGSVAIVGETTVTVRATNTSDPADNATYSMTTRRISYDSGDGTVVSYSNGAIVRSDDGNAVMRSDPDWLISENQSVIPFIVAFSATDVDSLGGDRTILLLTERRSQGMAGQFETAPGHEANVTVTVESSNAEAWERYLDEQGMDPIDADPADGDVTYNYTTKSLSVSRTTLETTLSD